MAEAVQEQEKKKGSLGKLLFILVNVLLFLAGLGFFLLTRFGILAPAPKSNMPHDASASQQQVAPQEQSAPMDASLEPQDGISQESLTVSVEPFVVNLSDKGGRRFLNLVMQVEVAGEQNKEEVEKRLPRIRNRLIFLLSGKKYADISSADGKYELQDEIRNHINDVLGKPLVKRVLFTRLVVQ